MNEEQELLEIRQQIKDLEEKCRINKAKAQATKLSCDFYEAVLNFETHEEIEKKFKTARDFLTNNQEVLTEDFVIDQGLTITKMHKTYTEVVKKYGEIKKDSLAENNGNS